MPVIPLVESAKGLSRLAQITEAPNVAMLAFGSIDFALDLGCSEDWQALLAVPSKIVWCLQAADLPQPLNGVTANLGDPEVVESYATHAVRFGFGGKMAVHPKQITPVRQPFQATPQDEITWTIYNVFPNSREITDGLSTD